MTSPTVSVDVSAAQFDRADFIEDVAEALAETGFDPAHLTLALAETTLALDVPTTIDRLHRVKALGVRVALGEFDSGYSSLTFLQRFPIDILTVDRSLLAETIDPGEAESLTDTLGQLGRVFGVDIIIEGPEGEDDPLPPVGAADAPASASVTGSR